MNLRALCSWPVFVLALVGCVGRSGAPQTTAAPSESAAIAWFDGSVDGAFIAARRERRPVFLYWGASWCPPCQQLKSTVFSRSDFIEKTRLFVPVHIDGDDQGAQKWGDQFAVQGYPTLVVLDADRHELLRIAGGMDLAQYATVLDTALADLQPVSVLLDRTVGGDKLNADECHRLAFNAWGLDDLKSEDFPRRSQELTAAAAACPPEREIERARLQIFAGYFAAESNTKDEAARTALGGTLDQVQAILQRPALALAVADALQYLDKSFFTAVQAHGPAYARSFRGQYVAVMDAASNDAHFAPADQLAAIASKLEVLKIVRTGQVEAGASGTGENGANKLPAPVVQAAKARIAAALASTEDPYVRSGIINSALDIYDTVDDNATAYKVVRAEIPNSATPYYYEADLAELAERLGHRDEALQLFDQAYRDSKGAATRFQWGQLYVSGLLRLVPGDTVRIENAGTQVLAELDGPDRIYRRARVRLEKLDRELRAWNMAARGRHDDVLQTLRTRMQQICVKIPNAEPARSSCDAFLQPATRAETTEGKS